MVTNGLTDCDRVCFFAEFAMITALTGWGDHQGEELRSSAQGGQIPIYEDSSPIFGDCK
ncbi:hypothetical protein VGJphip12 [Vibrio phage VGJ]|uniref:Uncharacterized protein orf58 n=1 Tax=Vibrio phage VGJ TaxID=223524 RepID=Q858Q2_9VIRU|nr:hypothetical protein VGJphip12 [Vibrio phage VGJ]AAO93107.1 hypothetical protein [Vibrio phage VGJ]